ncbi:hypothetical protein DSO57_1025113 [Entomophthora muscae]|uniref:Uncharacterized protein n=1 Tax=Entomophthora muscae TaxID=34485 RepID=A0ACC2UP08_9FUNG|nr:hypothetical protein DSO57_1025113 [Entomophthora muscae]
MIGIPVGFALVKFNLGALLHSIGERLPNEWIPDNNNDSTLTYEAVPESTHKQIKPADENSPANAIPTSPGASNYFIGSRGDEKLLTQEYYPVDNNVSAHETFQTAKQTQPQMIDVVFGSWGEHPGGHSRKYL